MNQTTKQVKYTRDQDSELNIESIISAPLIALSKANTVMLNGQALSILSQYFVKVKKKKRGKYQTSSKEVYKPIMINMTLTRYTDFEGDTIKHDVIFQVPLVSIAPINSIAIEKMKLTFNLDITSTTSYINNSNGIIERKAQLNGKITNLNHNYSSEQQHSKSNQRSLKIDIQAGPLPLPLGILNILDIYSKNIQPSNIK